MASTRSEEMNCWICNYLTSTDEMVERKGFFYCDLCARLPPYSEPLFKAIVGFQGLFRAYFKAKASPCFNCEIPTLHLHDYEGGKVCGECYEDLHVREHEHEHECSGCGRVDCWCDAAWCEKCEGQWGCVCAEQEEDARLIRHRRICGFPDCEGGCGTLDCGCVDKCKCEGWWVGLSPHVLAGGWGEE